MLIITFFLFTSSKLLPNENPYTILGVSKYASMDEIKKTYRKLVFACHPDRHKDEESYHKFIKVSEAYEILSDQEKKMQFDRDGRIKEKTVHREDNEYARNIQVPLINQHIFPSLAKNGEEWIILVTQHFDCPNCARQSQVFDEFAKEAGQYVKVGKLDATSSPDLVEQLGAKSFPAYFSVHYINGTVKSRKFATIFDNKDQAIQHLFTFWKSSVKYLNSQANLDSWLEIDSSKTHVLEILSRSNSKTSIHFRYAASKIGGYALFSSITESDELISKYNIKKTPCVLIFRGHKTNPIQIDTKGRHILDDIEEFCTPLFSYVNSANYKQICQPWCVVATSLPNRTYIDSISDYPFNLALIQSSFAKSLSLTSGWAVISDEKYMKVEVSSPDDLISVCSRLYRNDGLKDEGEEIKHSVFLGFVDTIMSIFSGFEINNGKIVLTMLQIAIPIPLVIAVGVLISVFLFICGLYDHTISNEQKIAKVKKDIENKQTKKEVIKDQNKEETKVEEKESVEKKEDENKDEKKLDDKHEKDE